MAALTAAVSLPLGAALAEDLPREGRFSITYTGVNTSPAKPVPYGKDREAVVGVSLMTAVNDAGSGLLHNMAGRCQVVTLIDRGAKTQEMRAYCVYTDRTGDQVFEEVSTPAPTGLGQPARWVGKWAGGTGKYAGLAGEFEVTNSGNIGTDGIYQAAGKKTGSYRLEK
ncbi:MAG: hypothetical protein JSS43_06630 [Proteobacteria bacterium]|nr:hypothetical protein [Pseudomonadota bacterium]